jgi:hypothetical protein
MMSNRGNRIFSHVTPYRHLPHVIIICHTLPSFVTRHSWDTLYEYTLQELAKNETGGADGSADVMHSRIEMLLSQVKRSVRANLISDVCVAVSGMLRIVWRMRLRCRE